MPTDKDIPPQYSRVRISTIDDDVVLQKLEELEDNTREEMAAMREEIRSLKGLIEELVKESKVATVVTNSTPRKRRKIERCEEEDLDESVEEDDMDALLAEQQNGQVPQSPLDDDDNEQDQADDQQMANNDHDNDTDENVADDGKDEDEEDEEEDDDENKDEMQVDNQDINQSIDFAGHDSFGEDLFNGSEENIREKDSTASSYPCISSSDIPSSFSFESPVQQRPSLPPQQQQQQQLPSSPPQQQLPSSPPQQQLPSSPPQQQLPSSPPPQQQQQPPSSSPPPQSQQQPPSSSPPPQPQQQPPSSPSPSLSPSSSPSIKPKPSPSQPPKYRLITEPKTVEELWNEWKVGDNCIEKLIERYELEWCHENDVSAVSKRRVVIQEIEFIARACNDDDDYETKCHRAVAALDERRKERGGSLGRLIFLIKAFQNNADQAVSYDGTGEREPYISL
ncbi:hypothetical protein K492DRAFT_225722 [Lichtheimia hyalospora FSU 10163]|nr:hypothetical protein K492DRAFT_225722 [Lichtheimia hyalospora FSU 10163]